MPLARDPRATAQTNVIHLHASTYVRMPRKDERKPCMPRRLHVSFSIQKEHAIGVGEDVFSSRTRSSSVHARRRWVLLIPAAIRGTNACDHTILHDTRASRNGAVRRKTHFARPNLARSNGLMRCSLARSRAEMARPQDGAHTRSLAIANFTRHRTMHLQVATARPE